MFSGTMLPWWVGGTNLIIHQNILVQLFATKSSALSSAAVGSSCSKHCEPSSDCFICTTMQHADLSPCCFQFHATYN